MDYLRPIYEAKTAKSYDGHVTKDLSTMRELRKVFKNNFCQKTDFTNYKMQNIESRELPP